MKHSGTNVSAGTLVAQMVKNLLQCLRPVFYPWVRKISWRRKWQPTLAFVPGKFHGYSLAGYSPQGWIFAHMKHSGKGSQQTTVKNKSIGGKKWFVWKIYSKTWAWWRILVVLQLKVGYCFKKSCHGKYH